jgi:acetolactate synthase-1/3 small subunit
MADAHTVSVLLDDELLTLNRAVGALRRRRMGVARFALGPAGDGEARLTFVLAADADAADRVARQLAKLVGVRSVVVLPGDQPGSHELALVRVRDPGGLRAELWRAVARFPATIVSEGPDGVVVRVAGPERVVQSLIEGLEPFAILDVARSGPVTLGATAFTPEEVAS